MTGSWQFLLALFTFALVGRLVLAVGGRARVPMFAALNLGTAAALYYRQLAPFTWWFLIYVALVAFAYLLLIRFARRKSGALPSVYGRKSERHDQKMKMQPTRVYVANKWRM